MGDREPPRIRLIIRHVYVFSRTSAASLSSRSATKRAWRRCLSGAVAMAQVSKPAEMLSPAQVIDARITSIEQEVVPAADAMPEDKYSFAPSNGEFTGVRTFGATFTASQT
jgi:hypothetical protein